MFQLLEHLILVADAQERFNSSLAKFSLVQSFLLKHFESVQAFISTQEDDPGAEGTYRLRFLTAPFGLFCMCFLCLIILF
jgi:hypothetical protein